MGLFDNVKDSIPGHHEDSGSDSGSNSFDDSKFDSSFDSDNDFGDSDFQSDNGLGNEPPGPASQEGRRPNDQSMGMQNSPSGGRRDQEMNNSRDRNRGSRNGTGRSRGNPNAQAGRPEPGSTEPQISSNTERKMENAGFNMNGQRSNSRSGRAGGESIADQRDDIQELKSQNEQIIELLKRISQSLNAGNNRPGRRSGRR